MSPLSLSNRDEGLRPAHPGPLLPPDATVRLQALQVRLQAQHQPGEAPPLKEPLAKDGEGDGEPRAGHCGGPGRGGHQGRGGAAAVSRPPGGAATASAPTTSTTPASAAVAAATAETSLAPGARSASAPSTTASCARFQQGDHSSPAAAAATSSACFGQPTGCSRESGNPFSTERNSSDESGPSQSRPVAHSRRKGRATTVASG